ncbi:ABC transporter ATP-binding protein [Kribbella sandramycini]|uniref:ABC transporter ATP-binding protein n=1 Tax=Kribbella sandramycini TaxID=60450 RepID=A0A7Y4KVK4_9ACTN|nr:ABC transporter ATP-binding protein [Kribbella sandramycini]MBB6567902.1 ABC-type multidrug transport system fused ATPase/permease subunit [Kribbella sandramycini]NOL39503.1 ABC transporter ATP-binding protein [Kribbella sandramycini]
MTTTQQTPPQQDDSEQSWRGVYEDEGTAELSKATTVRLKEDSRKLLGELLRPYKKLIWLLVVIVVVENAARLAVPYLVHLGIDNGIPPILAGEGPQVLITVVIAVLVSALLQAFTRQLFLMRSGRLGQTILLGLRRRVFDHFQRLSPAFHDKYTSGRVISRLTSDVAVIDEMLATGFDGLVTAVLTLLGTSILLLVLDLELGLIALLSFPVLLLLTAWFRRRSAVVYRRTREAVVLVIVHFVESMTGIRAVQAFRREPRNEEIFHGVNDQYREANYESFRLNAIFMPSIKGVGNITIVAILAYGGYQAYHGHVTVGVLAAFLLYLRQFFEPLQEISQFYNTFLSASAALEKLSGVLNEEPDVPEPAKPVQPASSRGHLELRGVRFQYVDGVTVLPGLDLDVPAGQTLALVGTTGAGKTTIAKLVSRFYDPTGGRVLLDGQDLRDLSEDDLRERVVMVTQENFLFTGSVADNIRFGKPSATLDEVVEAAKVIGAHDFITALPNGYETQVEKRGSRLSAGQRQLVAFARAFLADPAVLILDEATSSLDIPSERLIQRALRTILADRTAIVIAHRLSTVETADRVLVLEHGQILEDGPPDVLTGSGGHYAGLHRAWEESLA